MKKYCFALDLIDDEKLIWAYEKQQKEVWPEVIENIKKAGIEQMDIYRFSNRLFMIIEVNDTFSFEKKSAMDAANPIVQEWEKFMWKFQQSIPVDQQDKKWQLMEQIFELQIFHKNKTHH